ncbi:hypothetical protein [Phyllobacterium sp. YR531]|uniref:hypothetical protein n=1 Tax=Phyllobacterium sp. YR531 TaxID=1144343 RepID=UPI00026F9027|nr:hypothetical protein [Phyllobacterium sp. YR531]EJN01398.1 hypothetical protein PMI41_03480 [Phyllobacterium sp. YR531]
MKTTLFAMAMRRRGAFSLCREYGISPGEIAPLLGLTEQSFLAGLHRDGLSLKDMQGNGQLRAARKIMELLRKELETLSAIESETSSKARLDALALLARTIDKVSDLQDRFDTARARSSSGLSPEELRVVLKRIDERIEELAHIRARELGITQSEQAGDGSSRSGVGVHGADDTTATAK